MSHFNEIILFESSGRHRRSTYTNAAGLHRRTLLIRNAVLVQSDAYFVACILQILTGEFVVGEIEQEYVIVGTTGYNIISHLDELLRESFAVENNLMCIFLKFRTKCLLCAYSFSGNDVFKRAALCIWEYRAIHLLCEFRDAETGV